MPPHPTAERLQKLIELLLSAGGLSLGHEADEGHSLWAAALNDSPRMRTPFDELGASFPVLNGTSTDAKARCQVTLAKTSPPAVA